MRAARVTLPGDHSVARRDASGPRACQHYRENARPRAETGRDVLRETAVARWATIWLRKESMGWRISQAMAGTSGNARQETVVAGWLAGQRRRQLAYNRQGRAATCTNGARGCFKDP